MGSPRQRSDVPEFAAASVPPAVVERVADRFRLFGDPTRLRLINALHTDGELTVGALVDRVGVSYGAVSKQLSLLRAHGVVDRRQEGTFVHYRIGDPVGVRALRGQRSPARRPPPHFEGRLY